MNDKNKSKEQLINELKKMRRQLAELKTSEIEVNPMLEIKERYRNLFEDSKDAIFITTREGKFIEVNQSMLDLFGYTKEEMTELSVLEIYINPGDRVRFQQEIEQKGSVRDYGLKLRKKDGTEIDSLVTARLIFSNDGSMLGYQGIVRDITERKRAEDTTREQIRQYELIIQAALDGFLMVDINGKILKVNQTTSMITGYPPEEMVRMNVRDLEVEGISPEWEKLSQRMMEKKSDRFERKSRCKNGQVIDLEVASNYVEMGEKSFLFAFVRDITEQKRIERELKKRESDLEIRTKSLEEVNTALTILLKKRGEDKAELEGRVLSNVKELVMPFLERLKRSQLNDKQMAYVSIVESNLENIISSFAQKLSLKYLALTPSEIQIANLIKEGKTTKEIAEVLNVSTRTVEFHRNNIREKTGIRNAKVNLRSCLLTFYNT